ncbi:hypothetical protein EJF36_06430 [Bacillus sp. HMF5848]|uniref:YjcG family protein n=1 Tax=Bacillus sp. HMF5848 TaxID=2495421 RepID=UPI000F786D70|nr:YjcG family protein [Bacillus sp. HMF5848]RSK26524.1 hypothetical protein EJF36_06430 [Bacillus sp. HMF5848]
MKYGIAIFPSKKVQDLANSYRMRYDPHYALIPPHVTLREPFEIDESELTQLPKLLKEIAASHKPFPLRFDKVSSFYPVNNVVYFKVQPHEEMTALQRELHNSFLPTTPEHAFVPHITIGQRLSDDEHADVLGQLRMTEFNHEENIDRFHLLYQLDNGSWTVFETFRLGV